ncbi:MAG: hypothetical protein JKY65_04135 [Planctomycetes bacterium]|nr:hypothetical protein [Planctomycetota bacterium]
MVGRRRRDGLGLGELLEGASEFDSGPQPIYIRTSPTDLGGLFDRIARHPWAQREELFPVAPTSPRAMHAVKHLLPQVPDPRFRALLAGLGAPGARVPG